jgi:predicted amidohydrolase YtcJ
MAGVAAAVTRHTPDGRPGSEGWNPAARVSLAEALAAYTTGPAWACGMERVLGRIAPGALADAVVFERPLADVPREAVHAQRPIATLFAGEWAYGGV